ncbi:MAG TPA: 3-oxoadipate enol-lactonase [Pelomicrobium sp.]|nr:3-oxoadipate enol-lactonase [Pelomicrobium sp.]
MEVKRGGVKIHYEVDGDGPCVVLSHSLACHSAMWEPQIAYLKSRYCVLTIDTRGHGLSDAPAGPYTLEQLTEDVIAALDDHGVGRVHFVGLSMGGMLGQLLALAHPERLASLTLADTTSRFPPGSDKVWAERIATATGQGMQALVEPTLARWFTADFRARGAGVLERVGAMIRSTPVAGYVGCCHAIPKIDTTDRLGEIRCPTLVIVGEDDPGTPVAMAKTIHDAIQDSELTVIPKASHLCNLERPDAFNRVLGGFLDRVAPH